MSKYIERESYLHRQAKELLAEKLREQEKDNDFCELCGIQWRKNYGVFTELKFYETSDPYYFELSDGLNYDDNRGTDCLKWFDPFFDRGKILFVPDITIFHKGVASIFIEVVHTHEVNEKKINDMFAFFPYHWFDLYEVSAYEILKNKTNENFNCNFKTIVYDGKKVY